MIESPKLLVSEVQDIYLRKNFQNLQDYFKSQNQLLNFNFFEIVFPQAVAGFIQAHGLTTTPQDILVTRITGAGAVTFNYGAFDKTNLSMDVSGPCRIRFFVGTYFNFVSSVANASSDVQRVLAVPKQG